MQVGPVHESPIIFHTIITPNDLRVAGLAPQVHMVGSQTFSINIRAIMEKLHYNQLHGKQYSKLIEVDFLLGITLA